MSNRDARWLREKRRNFQGLGIRHCQKAWRILGGFHEPVRKTGETKYVHPNIDRPIIMGRGKDGTPRLVREIRRLSDRLTDEEQSSA